MANVKVQKNALNMIRDITKCMHPEYGMTKIKKLSLSRADCDQAIMIAQAIARNNGYYPYDLMPVYGEVRELFKKYGLPFKQEGAIY